MEVKDTDIVDLLIEHELAIKELYEKFSEIYKYHGPFWQNLAMDERRHADWLSRLKSRSAMDSYLLENAGLRAEAVKISISYVRKQIWRAEEGGMNIIQALSTARDLENALLEKQFNRTRDTAPPELKPLFQKLAGETEKHRESIIEKLNSLRNSRV